MPLAQCQQMAHRVILQVRNDKVAFGVKRTSKGGQRWLAQSRLTQIGPRLRTCLPVRNAGQPHQPTTVSFLGL
jgi:hypothetical protein